MAEYSEFMDYTMDVANMKGKKEFLHSLLLLFMIEIYMITVVLNHLLLYYLCYIQVRLYITMQNM